MPELRNHVTRTILIAFLSLLLLTSGVCYWIGTKPPASSVFSIDEYNDGFVVAIQTNATWGSANMCTIDNFAWQEGYDDGKQFYQEIYPEPSGYDMHPSQRIYEVMVEIDKSTSLEQSLKDEILDDLAVAQDYWLTDLIAPN